MAKESVQARISEISSNINLEIERIESILTLIKSHISFELKECNDIYIALDVVNNLVVSLNDYNNQLNSITGD